MAAGGVPPRRSRRRDVSHRERRRGEQPERAGGASRARSARSCTRRRCSRAWARRWNCPSAWCAASSTTSQAGDARRTARCSCGQRARRDFESCRWSPSRADCFPPSCRRARLIGGSTTTPRSRTAAGRARRFRRREQRRRSTSGRSRRGRRSTSEPRDSASSERRRRSLATLRMGEGRRCARARQRPGAVTDRAVGLRRRSGRFRRRARPGQSAPRAAAQRSEAGPAADRLRRR